MVCRDHNLEVHQHERYINSNNVSDLLCVCSICYHRISDRRHLRPINSPVRPVRMPAILRTYSHRARRDPNVSTQANLGPRWQTPAVQSMPHLVRKSSTSSKASNIGAQGQAPTGGATDGGATSTQGRVHRITNIRSNSSAISTGPVAPPPPIQ